jgi:ribosomal protein S18 acetylase RimI-like enzyme
MPPAAIRPYDDARDAAALRVCFVELQEFEHALDPHAPRGEPIADAYLAVMFERCAKWAGRVFVAESDGRVVGFVCVWGRVPPQEIDDEPTDAAYVSDLVVLPRWRGHGIGTALLARAEAFARESGVASIGMGVMAENRDARRLYDRLGWTPVHIELSKRLS